MDRCEAGIRAFSILKALHVVAVHCKCRPTTIGRLKTLLCTVSQCAFEGVTLARRSLQEQLLISALCLGTNLKQYCTFSRRV